MPLITLDNIFLSFSDKPILNGINATIHKGDKIALIGRNGEGKSTLMRVLAGQIEHDDGELKIKNNIKISYLEQTPPQDSQGTLFEIVASGLGEVGQVLGQYQNALWQEDLTRTGDFQTQIEQLNAWQHLHKIEAILNRFNLPLKINFQHFQAVGDGALCWRVHLLMSPMCYYLTSQPTIWTLPPF
jgi:ATP-binding cassette subfamily F protein uup